MSLKWIDIQDIALELVQKHPQIDPLRVNFFDLRRFVIELDGFDDDPARCGEKILEAIQAAWIDEMD